MLNFQCLFLFVTDDIVNLQFNKSVYNTVSYPLIYSSMIIHHKP